MSINCECLLLPNKNEYQMRMALVCEWLPGENEYQMRMILSYDPAPTPFKNKKKQLNPPRYKIYNFSFWGLVLHNLFSLLKDSYGIILLCLNNILSLTRNNKRRGLELTDCQSLIVIKKKPR